MGSSSTSSSSAHVFGRKRFGLRQRVLRRAVNTIEALEPRRLLANIVVDTAVDESIADNPTTSLREAIAQASLLGADDVISFDPDLFDPATGPHTISLLNGALSVPAGGGQITIDGPGDDATTLKIEGGGGSGGGERAFEIEAGADLIIRDGTIYNGDEFFYGDGAAIHNDGTLLLDNINLTGSTVLGQPGGVVHGGAIYSSGTLTIQDSRVSDNTVFGGGGSAGVGPGSNGGWSEGGAIYAAGDLTVRRTHFENNIASAGDGGLSPAGGGSGGAAFGGAIYSLDGNLLIEDSSFALNQALGGTGRESGEPGTTGGDGGNAFGGAIVGFAGTVTIVNSDFDHNSALGGAGGNDLARDGNGGEARGGAIYAGADLDITGGTISNSLARGGDSDESGVGGNAIGGAIHASSELTLTGTHLKLNHAEGGNSDTGFAGSASGGALTNLGGSVDIDSAMFDLNSAQGGGGLLGGVGEGGAIYTSGGDVGIVDTTLDRNIADGGPSDRESEGAEARGGGIMIQGGVVDITRSTLSFNTAFAGDSGTGVEGVGGDGGDVRGGGIANAGELHLTNSTIAGNQAIGGDGARMTGTTGNGGDARGAGIYNEGDLTALNVTIALNRLTGGHVREQPGVTAGAEQGGGVHNNGDATLTNTLIAQNPASSGESNLHGDFTLVHSLITTPPGDYTVLPGSSGNIVVPNALINELDDNGGATKTIELRAGSAAIDKGDDAAAEAEFGIDGTDQRGFDRFVGAHVDIGAVEQTPQILVTGNDHVIANNDTTPSATDQTDFGVVAQGAAGPTRTYRVTNIGGGTLELMHPAMPLGYVLTEPLDSELASGASDTFTVRLNTATPGTFLGEIVVSSNDPDDAAFKFAVTGTVTPIASTPPVKINFQPSGRPVPSGYLADVGLVFGNRGNGFSYGWNRVISSATRDRNINSDQKLDTLVHTQLYGSRTWEIGVPNGTYSVKLVAGDPQYFDSVYKINVEGVLTVNGTPSSGNRFITGVQTVTVSDGKLTVTNASGAVNNKINFIEIAPVTAPVKINFQPSGRPVPGGFLADTGAVFGSRGNGFSYGWDASASSFARDRGINSDQKLDTLIHTQLYGVRKWEFGVANGTYQVTLVAGDPQYFDSVYKINVEGQLTVNGTPTSGNRFITGTRTVTVSDGRLTISNASGSVNNKLAFMEVVKV